MNRITVAVVAAAAVLAAHAQTPTQFDGNWVAEFVNNAGQPATSEVQLKDGVGSWQFRVLGRILDPCPKLKAPASVVERDGETWLSVEYSKALAGCRDMAIKLSAPSADGVIKTSFRDGREVVLKKH